MNITALKFGVIGGFLYVIISAFGAHALQDLLTTDRQEWFNTAADYQIIHSLALIMLGLYSSKYNSAGLIFVIWSFVAGIILFSGSLYAIALGAPSFLAIFTPIGGMFFLAAWLAWFFVIVKNK